MRRGVVEKLSESKNARDVTTIHRENQKSFKTTHQKTALSLERHQGQVTKGIRWMPWHWEPKKDVTSCDKLRAGANIR